MILMFGVVVSEVAKVPLVEVGVTLSEILFVMLRVIVLAVAYTSLSDNIIVSVTITKAIRKTLLRTFRSLARRELALAARGDGPARRVS